MMIYNLKYWNAPHEYIFCVRYLLIIIITVYHLSKHLDECGFCMERQRILNTVSASAVLVLHDFKNCPKLVIILWYISMWSELLDKSCFIEVELDLPCWEHITISKAESPFYSKLIENLLNKVCDGRKTYGRCQSSSDRVSLK